MTIFNIRINPLIFSIVFHLLLLLLFFLIKFTIDYPAREFIELGFGNSGSGFPSGGLSSQFGMIQQSASTEQPLTQNREVKEVQLPTSENTEDDNVISQAEKSKDKNTETKSEKSNLNDANNKKSSSAMGAGGEGPAGFGVDIDFGGRGIRKIYSYSLPKYPEGVLKEIDVKLRFTILPDGTVGTIIPLIKVDSRLENAAINSLRQWRFEPLPKSQKQFDQTAIIVFPYRLR